MTTRRTCAVVYDVERRRYCGREATMIARERDGSASYWCIEHGPERGAVDLDPAAAARAEAETRAHDRVSPKDRYDAIGAVNLYVVAFVAGARFEAERCGGVKP